MRELKDRSNTTGYRGRGASTFGEVRREPGRIRQLLLGCAALLAILIVVNSGVLSSIFSSQEADTDLDSSGAVKWASPLGDEHTIPPGAFENGSTSDSADIVQGQPGTVNNKMVVVVPGEPTTTSPSSAPTTEATSSTATSTTDSTPSTSPPSTTTTSTTTPSTTLPPTTSARPSTSTTERADAPEPVVSVVGGPEFQEGDAITVAWANGSTVDTAWVGVFTPGSPDVSYREWIYTAGAASGSYRLIEPLAPGTYEIRLFADNDYNRIATTTFTVS